MGRPTLPVQLPRDDEDAVDERKSLPEKSRNQQDERVVIALEHTLKQGYENPDGGRKHSQRAKQAGDSHGADIEDVKEDGWRTDEQQGGEQPPASGTRGAQHDGEKTQGGKESSRLH